MLPRLKQAIRIILLLLGLAVFGWFVREVDPRQIWVELRQLGGLAPLVLAPYLAVYLTDTLGWRFAFGKDFPGALPYLALFRIRWMGEAVSNVTPTAQLGGEAVKVYLLGKRGFSTLQATASVVVGKTIQFSAQVVFLTCGAVASLSLFEDSPSVRQGIAIVMVLCAGSVASLFWLQQRGLFGSIIALLSRLRIRLKRFEAQIENLRSVDQRIIEYYRDERSHFAASLCFYFGGWMLDTLEILLVAYLMGVPLDWTQALAIEAFIGVAKGFGSVAPGSIGIQETGIVLLCRLAGASDTFGVAYAVVRRARELIYAGLGWLMLVFEESTIRGFTARVERDSQTRS
jgi:uncharacterized protein (TIRG00374 family)